MKKALLFSLIFATGSAFAISFPSKCPSVSELKKIQLQQTDLLEIEKSRDTIGANGFPIHDKGTWGIKDTFGTFGTIHQWSFSLHNVSADNAKEAFPQLQDELNHLSFGYGPTKEMMHWYCAYYSSRGEVVAWFRG